MTEFEEVTRRLSALGSQPVDPDVAARHMAMMSSIPAREARRGRLRPALAGALLAGTVLGGGVAGSVTGTLPGPAQDAVHGALSRVGVKVPDGDGDSTKAGKGAGQGSEPPAAGGIATEKATAPGGAGHKGEPGAGASGGATTAPAGKERVDCGPFNGNHGQWVAAHPDDPVTTDRNEREEAAKSDCGKPERAVEPRGEGTGKPADPGRSGEPGRPTDPGKPGDPGRPPEPGKPPS